MARAGKRSFNIEFDVGALLNMGARLGEIDAQSLSAETVEALNAVTENIYDVGRSRMIRNINLTDEYLKRKMELKTATPADPKASITAVGRPTVLGRFDSKPVVADAVSPRHKLKGNAALGIPVGKKQAGVSLRVKRSEVNVDFVPRGFLLPLRAGNVDGGNGFGVFARGRGYRAKAKHRTGPSPYQLFKVQIPKLIDEAGDAFEIEVVDRVNQLIDKALK